MARKELILNGKKLSIFFLLLLIGLSTFGVYKHSIFETKLDYLESENDDLNDKISDLESQLDDLQSELDDAIADKEKYENLYDVLSTNYDNLLERATSYNSYTNNSYSNSGYYNTTNTSSQATDVSIPNFLSKSYLDGGYIIKPSFGNLHYLMKMTNTKFESKMHSNNYSLTTTRESYINNDTKTVYCTIDKEWNSVSMIITQQYFSDIESFFSKNNIDYTYKNGGKVYDYRLSGQSYNLLIKNSYDSFFVLLEKE